jgi:hypothetical protein
MKEAPLSDSDISARTAMVDHLDTQERATHGTFNLSYGTLCVASTALLGIGFAFGVVLSWLGE